MDRVLNYKKVIKKIYIGDWSQKALQYERLFWNAKKTDLKTSNKKLWILTKKNYQRLAAYVFVHFVYNPGSKADLGFSPRSGFSKQFPNLWRPFLGGINWVFERSQNTIETLFWQNGWNEITPKYQRGDRSSNPGGERIAFAPSRQPSLNPPPVFNVWFWEDGFRRIQPGSVGSCSPSSTPSSLWSVCSHCYSCLFSVSPPLSPSPTCTAWTPLSISYGGRLSPPVSSDTDPSHFSHSWNKKKKLNS